MNAHPQTGTAVAAFKPTEILASMEASGIDKGMTAIFLPATMREAMELAGLMSESNFMPKHLRCKPGDCLAVVIQASGWGMNAYAVANKSYFVNDRMAYEAQLVNSVVNASKVLDGRLNISWDGQGENLICTVKGKIKGDPQVKVLDQEIRTIKTRNSPLWGSSPRVQLAYYTTRAWARLYTPEVLMGVYTPDEIEDITPEADGSTVIPPKPTRPATALGAAVANSREKLAADRATREESESAQADTHDMDAALAAGERNRAEAEARAQEPTEDPAADAPTQRTYAEVADEIISAINDVRDGAGLRQVMDKYSEAAEELRHDAATEFARVNLAVKAKRAGLPR